MSTTKKATKKTKKTTKKISLKPKLTAEQAAEKELIKENRRVTKAEKKLRETQCARLLLQGYRPEEIIALFRDKYSLKIRQIQRYINAANKTISDICTINTQADLDLQLKRYENLYTQALRSKKFSVAEKVLTRIDILKGLEPSKKIGVEDGDGNEIIKINITKNYGNDKDKKNVETKTKESQPEDGKTDGKTE